MGTAVLGWGPIKSRNKVLHTRRYCIRVTSDGIHKDKKLRVRAVNLHDFVANTEEGTTGTSLVGACGVCACCSDAAHPWLYGRRDQGC